jgi:septum formation topological specificity factor MinE
LQLPYVIEVENQQKITDSCEPIIHHYRAREHSLTALHLMKEAIMDIITYFIDHSQIKLNSTVPSSCAICATG